MKTFKEVLSPSLEDKALLYLTFDDLVTKTCELRMCKDLPEIQSRIRGLLHYHFLNGNHERAMLNLAAYCEIVPTEKRTKSALLAAWISEITYLMFITMDDTLSKNHTSFGQLCWWMVAESNAQALNDVLLLQTITGAFYREELSGVYRNFNKFSRSTVRHHLISNRYYEQVVLQNSFDGVTMENYKRVTTHKIKSLGVYLPLCSAIYSASNDHDYKIPKQLDDVLKDLIFFLTVKEDVRNHFHNGMKNVSLFSWVLLKAKEICDKITYTKLLGWYKEDPINVTSISGVYEKINLRFVCEKWVEKEALDLEKRVKDLEEKNVPKNVILELIKS